MKKIPDICHIVIGESDLAAMCGVDVSYIFSPKTLPIEFMRRCDSSSINMCEDCMLKFYDKLFEENLSIKISVENE